MTKQEIVRRIRQENMLMSLGFTRDEADKLRRISMTLRRWHELECGIDGGCVERDETTGKAFWRSSTSGKAYPIADREKGAKNRLKSIIRHRNGRTKELNLDYHIQGDPRGAALYIIRPGDIPEGQSVDSCYSRGICVY